MNRLLLKMYGAAQSILARPDAQSITEYAMAFSLIALGCVAGQSAVARSVNHTFIAMATTITTSISQ
jgi:Flp pilus assembly pilin Flp